MACKHNLLLFPFEVATFTEDFPFHDWNFATSGLDMDREKRRSEEEEKELDRRIALIREKNQQIEQRTKVSVTHSTLFRNLVFQEIEEDRARTEDSTAKSPKVRGLEHNWFG